jgi:hypothetical protein
MIASALEVTIAASRAGVSSRCRSAESYGVSVDLLRWAASYISDREEISMRNRRGFVPCQ